MAASATRKSVTEFKKLLVDENSVIIPNELFLKMLEDNSKTQDLLTTSIQSIDASSTIIATALQQLATTTERMYTTSSSHTDAITNKMDELIARMGTVNALSSSAVITDKDLETIANKHTEKENQRLRANDLVTLYKELLDHEPPYAPRKHRTIINRNTPEFEKSIRSEDTKHKMNQEILVMTARIKQLDTEINGLQLEINEYKSKLETARAERFDKLIQDKLNNYKAEWNDNLSWLKNEYNRDMESGATQFLLKYSDEKDSDNSSQRRSDQKNWNRQGNNNNNRSGGNFSNRNNSNNWNNNWNNNLEDAKLWLPIQSRPRFGLFFVGLPNQNKTKENRSKGKKEKKTVFLVNSSPFLSIF